MIEKSEEDEKIYFEDHIDHSIITRRHAQFLANVIADEGRLGQIQSTEHNSSNKIRPIWAYAVSTIEYSSAMGESSMPYGLSKQDVYFIKWG